MAPAPDRVSVTDITYIWTKEGWLYLAAVIELFSRRVVGWAASERIDAALCCEAKRRALLSRRPAPGLVLHSEPPRDLRRLRFLSHAALGRA